MRRRLLGLRTSGSWRHCVDSRWSWRDGGCLQCSLSTTKSSAGCLVGKAPSNPVLFSLKTQETSNAYSFPMENSLQVGKLSILGGLHIDPSLGTRKNDRRLRKTWRKVCTWDKKAWVQLQSWYILALTGLLNLNAFGCVWKGDDRPSLHPDVTVGWENDSEWLDVLCSGMAVHDETASLFTSHPILQVRCWHLPLSPSPHKGSCQLFLAREWSSLPSAHKPHPWPYSETSPGEASFSSLLWNAPTVTPFWLPTWHMPSFHRGSCHQKISGLGQKSESIWQGIVVLH